ncbi:SET and MYND domain-containing protein 4-like [Teleopsis dalmanni]|uniref:SET and MYND domain-containing protein 4-like n=1 Tax=Teleopsis dalmanni TaxID=139649 RepID=UPI0018CCADAA|nr:SET and MYND domain-containing protein 4-like [Teleopsis dalmanni]
MDMQSLFMSQASFLILDKYENEFETISILHNLPEEKRISQTDISKDWLSSLSVNEKEDQNTAVKSSVHYREVGNRFFASNNERRNVVAATNLYTKAIFAAPEKSEALALAHANRATALQELGYYQQAYDDCECALEEGYPSHLIHKVLTRQAYCAWKLKDVDRLSTHLDALSEKKLNESFMDKYKQLRNGLNELLKNKNTEESSKQCKEVVLEKKSQQIKTSLDERGRYMVASEDIGENEVVFVERAQSILPVNRFKICQQCAATLIIPFPCRFCYMQVFYCSLECKKLHKNIHSYECVGYQKQLFGHVGIAHLAMRIMLEGLPQFARNLECTNAKEIWESLMNSNNLKNIEYVQSLNMITHLGEMAKGDIVWFALVADLLVTYLDEYTEFFNNFSKTAACLSDWKLVTGALILRHIGQLIVNGHTFCSIVAMPTNQNDNMEFTLLSDDMWNGAYRLKLGFLHKFCSYEETAAANLPYLSICNHACIQSFQSKFSGRYVHTHATNFIPKNKEIFNCYTLDYRKSKHKHRSEDLKDVYKFKCKCIKCDTKNPDKDYEAFHQYRCENTECRKIFVPKMPNSNTLNWWDSIDELDSKNAIKCSICRSKQSFEWFNIIKNLLKVMYSRSSRHLLFETFRKLDNVLIDYHEMKLFFAYAIVSGCFNYIDGIGDNSGDHLGAEEFPKLVDVLKLYLIGVAKQCRYNSIEYVANMTYLWDLIAIGVYKCDNVEMRKMLDSLEMVSDEIKLIFMHYYEDHLKYTIN